MAGCGPFELFDAGACPVDEAFCAAAFEPDPDPAAAATVEVVLEVDDVVADAPVRWWLAGNGPTRAPQPAAVTTSATAPVTQTPLNLLRMANRPRPPFSTGRAITTD